MEINVEEIMAEIRMEIKEKGYSADMLSFRDVGASEYGFDINEFKNILDLMETNKYVVWKRDDVGRGLKGFVKKVIRKLVGFVIATFADGQNNYNQQVSAAFMQMLGYIEQQNRQLEEYDKEIKALKKTL